MPRGRTSSAWGSLITITSLRVHRSFSNPSFHLFLTTLDLPSSPTKYLCGLPICHPWLKSPWLPILTSTTDFHGHTDFVDGNCYTFKALDSSILLQDDHLSIQLAYSLTSFRIISQFCWDLQFIDPFWVISFLHFPPNPTISMAYHVSNPLTESLTPLPLSLFIILSVCK